MTTDTDFETQWTLKEVDRRIRILEASVRLLLQQEQERLLSDKKRLETQLGGLP